MNDEIERNRISARLTIGTRRSHNTFLQRRVTCAEASPLEPRSRLALELPGDEAIGSQIVLDRRLYQ